MDPNLSVPLLLPQFLRQKNPATSNNRLACLHDCAVLLL